MGHMVFGAGFTVLLVRRSGRQLGAREHHGNTADANYKTIPQVPLLVHPDAHDDW